MTDLPEEGDEVLWVHEYLSPNKPPREMFGTVTSVLSTQFVVHVDGLAYFIPFKSNWSKL